jgi:hypothetical protein
MASNDEGDRSAVEPSSTGAVESAGEQPPLIPHASTLKEEEDAANEDSLSGTVFSPSFYPPLLSATDRSFGLGLVANMPAVATPPTSRQCKQAEDASALVATYRGTLCETEHAWSRTVQSPQVALHEGSIRAGTKTQSIQASKSQSAAPRLGPRCSHEAVKK